MAKKKRVQVGSVMKSKNAGEPDYIKMRDGKTYRLESKKSQLDSLHKAVAEGKLSPDVAEKVEERINKIPDFVRFEIIDLVDAE